MSDSASGFAGYYDVQQFGAVGDGVTLCTAALQQAIEACHAAGGGKVVIPPGVYLTGTLYLKSHVTLHLQAGAILRGSPRREDYNPDDIFPENPVFTSENVSGAHLIIAYRAQQVAIEGEGTIDGHSSAFFEPLPPEETTTTYWQKSRNFPIRDWRPGQMVFFCCCTHVRVRDVSLLNAPYWTLFLLGCSEVQVRGLRIENPPQTANGDGLDIDCCRQVTVSDCLIRSGDDCLTLRGYNRLLGEDAPACENVTVTNCVLSSPCTAIRVGVGDGVVRNCLLSNLVITESRTGINFICAYSEKSRHGVTIENVHFSQVLMEAVVPFNVLLGQYAKPPAAIRDISFSHFRLRGRQGLYFGGNEGLPLTNLSLQDIELRLTGDDVDPEFAQKEPLPFGNNRVPAAVYLRWVQGLRVRDLRVVWEEISGGWQHGLVLEDCHEVRLAGLDIPAPPTAPEGESVHCRGVSDLHGPA
jgi:polygalacturonase